MIALCSPKQFKNEGELFIVHGKAFESLNLWRKQAMEPHNPLPYSFKVYKEETMEKRKTGDENRGHSCSLSSHFWSTSRSPFSTFYIPLQSSGSQESNTSNRVQFGFEMRKIWPLEYNCIRWRTISHLAKLELQRAKMDSKLRNQLAKFSQVTMQRAKLGYLCTDSFRSFLQIFLYKFPLFSL